MTADSDYRDFARTLALAAAGAVRPWFARADLRVDRKADGSPVTCADREAEAAMRDLIGTHFPDHGVLGEEYGNDRPDAEFVWVLDPIDGTIAFAAGVPLFTTLVGLLHAGQPILGVIHQPAIERLCIGDGTRTTVNGKPVRVRETVALRDALLLTTDLDNVARYQDLAAFQHLRGACGLFRTWGDAFGYLLVAEGHADLMLDPVMNPWDLLPLIPVIRGAGGAITGWDGGDPVTATSCVAGAPRLHAAALRILAEARAPSSPAPEA